MTGGAWLHTALTVAEMVVPTPPEASLFCMSSLKYLKFPRKPVRAQTANQKYEKLEKPTSEFFKMSFFMKFNKSSAQGGDVTDRPTIHRERTHHPTDRPTDHPRRERTHHPTGRLTK